MEDAGDDVQDHGPGGGDLEEGGLAQLHDLGQVLVQEEHVRALVVLGRVERAQVALQLLEPLHRGQAPHLKPC